MLRDPERFIQEKLCKKILSANTIRDAIIAAFLITLQKKAEQDAITLQLEDWRKSKAAEIRAIMNKAFAAIDAPSEYPSHSQLKRVKEAVEKEFAWNQLPDTLKKGFNLRCNALFSKFDTGYY